MNDLLDTRVPLFSLDRRKSTILRGIAIFYVLLGHAGYFYWGGAGGVALFLMLSGYGLDRSNEVNGLEGFWRKRALKVWLPYVLVGIFNVVALRAEGALQILCSVTGLDLGRNIDRSMWYISYILLWYVLFYLSVLLTRRISRESLRLWARFALLLLAVPGVIWLDKQNIWNPSAGAGNYAIFFPMGVALSALSRVRVSERLRRLVWMGLFFLASAYMFRVYGLLWTTRSALALALQVLAPSQLLKIGGGAERVLLWFGKYSYPIYLFEMTVRDHRGEWLEYLIFQPLVDVFYILLSALFAFAFWECWLLLEDIMTALLSKARRKAEE